MASGGRPRWGRVAAVVAALAIVAAGTAGARQVAGLDDAAAIPGRQAAFDFDDEVMFTLGLTSAFGSIWVLEFEGTVRRIDPATDEVEATIELGDRALSLLPTDDALWVSQFVPPGERSGEPDTLVRIDPGSGQVTDRLPTDDAVGIGSTGAAGGRLWVARQGAPILGIDPDTGEATPSTVPANGALGVGSVLWVEDDLDVTRWRVVDGSLTDPVSVASIPAETPGTFVAGPDRGWWFDREEAAIHELDPDGGPGRLLALPGPARAAADDGTALWVAAADRPVVWRVDPQDGTVRTFDTVVEMSSVAFAAGSLWMVPTRGATNLYRLDPAALREVED